MLSMQSTNCKIRNVCVSNIYKKLTDFKIMLFLIFCSLSVQELIKHSKEQFFLCDILNSNRNGREAAPCIEDEKTNWVLEQLSPITFIIREPRNGYVLNVNNATNRLVLSRPVDGLKSKFEIEKKSPCKYVIKYEDKCVEYDNKGRFYYMTHCFDSEFQSFMIIDDELIASGALLTGYKYCELNIPHKIY